MTLSDLIVSYLEQFGVEYVFSVPGSPLGPLYDALVRSQRRGGPRSILARHETGGAFIADGYARETGKIGVCCATTGPGATNLITGVACAYADHIPLLVITAQSMLQDFGRGSFQESSADGTDIVGMFEHCTRYNSLVTHPDQLENKLATALTKALQTPKGPVHLSVPVDILRSPADDQITYPNLRSVVSEPASWLDLEAMERLHKEIGDVLARKRRLVLLIGHDCRDATHEIMQFAELADAPIVTTQRGKACIDPYHPLARGVFGFAGHTTAREALTDDSVDLILAAGTDLGEWATGGWDCALLNDKLIHIHNAKTYFGRSPMARLHVYGTISTVFEQLASHIGGFRQEHGRTASQSPPDHSESSPYVPDQIQVQVPESTWMENTTPLIKPERVFCELTRRFPLDTRFLIDNSNSVPWSIHYFFHRHPKNFHLPIGFASMGWAIGAAVGVALGNRDKPVVCVTGDGCFLMSGQEITVAVAEQLPVIFVVLNDQAYGMIKHAHRLMGKEPVDFAIPPVDFCTMAQSVGARGYTIRHPKDFDNIDYQALCSHNGPTLLDVYIDPEEPAPLGML